MECKCDPEDAATGWLSSGNLQMGAFTVVGYVLYRFSQTLPALVRWPVRLFCSITGLSTLWSWVSRLIGTLCVIKTLYKYLSQLWHFLVRFCSKFQWLTDVIKVITGKSDADLSDLPGLRMVLLTSSDRPSSLRDLLLSTAPTSPPTGPLRESTKRTVVLNFGEINLIDAPALPGVYLDHRSRAREALRSLQLSSPGPHAFFIEISILNSGLHQDLDRASRAATELFGEEVTDYIVPVVTHQQHLSKRKVEYLLQSHCRNPKKGSVLCQKLEVVNVSPDRTADERNASRIQILKRVVEVKKLRGQFVHQIQRREDRVREELLTDMTSALASKLGHED